MTPPSAQSFDLTPIRSIYPFAQHSFSVDGGVLNYVDEGNGPAVIMLHGNPTWSFMYRRLIADLRRDFRVIVPDHIGCGLSSKPQNYSYRLEKHIEHVSALIQHLGITEADLIVHDWGGAIGFGYAIRREIKVRSFVVFNTAAFLSKNLPRRINMCRQPLLGDLIIRGLNGFALGATYMAVARPMAPEVRKGFVLPYNNWRNRVANLRFVQDIPMEPSHPTWAVVDGIDQQLYHFQDTPMRILWGAKDWCFDLTFLEGWMRRFPKAHVTLLDSAGHYVLEDAHEYCVPAVRHFLTYGC